jgi:RimJ/RimL family protein N-acetyltransferase
MKPLVKNDVTLRLVEESDAEFIFNLRQNEELSKYLNKVSSKIEDQTSFIKKSRELSAKGLEYYFIIEYKNEPVGTIRIYNINHELKTCTWGSWIIKRDLGNPKVSIISTFLIYKYCFESLGIEMIYFDVRKENLSVQKFHTSYGSKIVSEGETDIFFEFYQADFYNIFLDKFKKFLL